MLAHVRTTLIIDDRLLEGARQLSGIAEATAWVRAGQELLISRDSPRRLAALAGSDPRLRAIPRRRPVAK